MTQVVRSVSPQLRRIRVPAVSKGLPLAVVALAMCAGCAQIPREPIAQ